jgi:hypothetical protein
MHRILAALLIAVASPAAAHDPEAAQEAQLTGGHNPLDCYCRAQGRTYAVGDRVCLRTAQGPRIAECEMVLNVTSWGFTERPCPEA